MEGEQVQQSTSTHQPVAEELQEQPKLSKPSKIITILLVVVTALSLCLSGYLAYQNYLLRQGITQQDSRNIIIETPTPTHEAEAPIEETSVLEENGAGLSEIQFSLPSGWESDLRQDGLFISPIEDGGYLFLKVYDYTGDSGRRAYYCELTDYCEEGTYFTAMDIGNIPGYVANALDNSGGGEEYFGAKGNKFYIISSYSPPPPNNFDKGYKDVLDSLVF